MFQFSYNTVLDFIFGKSLHGLPKEIIAIKKDPFVAVVFKELEEKGNLEWTDKSHTCCNIYWRSPDEWGSLIYNFIKERGQTNTVCTLYELTEGPDAVGQPFCGLDEAVLLRSLQTLELQKKAEIFSGGEGVKVFLL